MVLLTCAVFLAAAGTAQAQTVCTAVTTAVDATRTIAVTCDNAAISRYFLLSPDLSALPAGQRADVLTQPMRYAFAYMESDAENRLAAAFADPSVSVVDLTETLISRDPAGKPVPHEMFRIRPARTDVTGVNWAKLAPVDLFKTLPSEISPYASQAMKAEAKGN